MKSSRITRNDIKQSKNKKRKNKILEKKSNKSESHACRCVISYVSHVWEGVVKGGVRRAALDIH